MDEIFIESIRQAVTKGTLIDLELRFPMENGNPKGVSLKAAWFAPDKYWIVLLPQEYSA